jgi:aspartyl-tRNA(Asn)/glutamyl-tRNA(Gln) amidotransferase subunit A
MTASRTSDVTALTLTEAAAAVSARELSPVELTETYLDRIAVVDPALNAYVTVTADRARRDAERAEREIREGRYRGALHGLPIGLKDLFDTAGIRTTAGSALRRAHIPDTDSAVAARLRASGAVLLGKHSTHEFAWGGTTNNPHYGPTRNPYDQSRIPGGSSGGSAASVAARTALASVGTDTCGSVRIPAALSGCVGLKPTYGLISLAGVTPLAPSLDHAGPIARTVADAALLFQVLAGTRPVQLPEASSASLAGLRVGWLRGWFEQVIDPEVSTAVAHAAARLAALGCTVDQLEVPDVGPVVDRVFDIVHAEAEPYHRTALRETPEAYGADLRANLGRTPPTADELATGRRMLTRLTDWLADALTRVDVLLTATTPTTAPPIGDEDVLVGGEQLHVEWMLTRLTSVFDVAGLPALSVPAGLSASGLPLGVQIIGRRLAESTVLSVGQAVEVRLPQPDVSGEGIRASSEPVAVAVAGREATRRGQT